MLILRYFIFVGGALLALLIGLSSILAEPEAITRPDAARPVIRIASDSVGPPRVDIDTRVPITVVPAAVVPASVPEVSPHAAEVLPQSPARVAQAQLRAPLPTRVLPARIERKKTRIAKRPDRQRMAANPLGVQAFPQGFQYFRSTW
jgi:hypothetical protein